MSSQRQHSTANGPDQPPVSRVGRGFIFDMDGVLCSSERPMAEAACQMFRELHGVNPRPEEFEPYMGRGSAVYFGEVARAHGVTAVLPRDRDRTYEIFRELIRGRLQPLPGVRELLDLLQRAGRPMAVATSADPIKLHAILEAIGIPAGTFQALVTAEDVARNKPAPDIFLYAAEQLGLPPNDCVVVEDTPPGIEAARAAGARCLGLCTTFPRSVIEAGRPDWVADDLASIPMEFYRACGLPVG